MNKSDCTRDYQKLKDLLTRRMSHWETASPVGHLAYRARRGRSVRRSRSGRGQHLVAVLNLLACRDEVRVDAFARIETPITRTRRQDHRHLVVNRRHELVRRAGGDGAYASRRAPFTSCPMARSRRSQNQAPRGGEKIACLTCSASQPSQPQQSLKLSTPMLPLCIQVRAAATSACFAGSVALA